MRSGLDFDLRGQGGAPLVSSPKSHRRLNAYESKGLGKSEYFKPIGFEVNRNRLRIVREPKACPAKPPRKPDGAKINAFSSRSQRKLREVAANADPHLISMFVCTYADEWPRDGRVAKTHLDTFLKRIRRKLPGVGYLWVLEFQRRGAPHFHVFLTKPRSDALHRFLAKAWHEIAGEGQEKHLNVHMHRRSFIDWDMGQGNYVAKYLDKQNQKFVPDEYLEVGRFWGATRGLVPDPLYIKCRDMAMALLPVAPQAVKQATRWLCKWHEKHTRGHSYARRTGNCYTLPTGAPVLLQIIRYFERLRFPDYETSPF